MCQEVNRPLVYSGYPKDIPQYPLGKEIQGSNCATMAITTTTKSSIATDITGIQNKLIYNSPILANYG